MADIDYSLAHFSQNIIAFDINKQKLNFMIN